MKNSNRTKVLRIILITVAAIVTCAGAVILFLKRRTIFRRLFIYTLIADVMLCVMMCGTMTAYAAPEPKTEPDTTITKSSKTTTEPRTTEKITETTEDITSRETESEPETTDESESDAVIDTEVSEIITGEETEIDISGFISPDSQPLPLTPPGNFTLVDDLSGEQTEDKQFITVTTKSGNYFYIIIDRAGDKENVHFLNLVDEADLLAIMEKEKTDKPATTESTQEQTSKPEPTPQTKNNNTTGLIIMIVVITAGGGGAYYYFKVRKPKQGTAKNTATPELDEFEFDLDEDDFISIDTGEPDGTEFVEDNGDGNNENDDEIPDFTISDEPVENTELKNDSEDIPDFTIAADSEPENNGDFLFDIADFGGETPESEDRE